MAIVAAAIPLLPGKGEAWRQWVQELQGSRRTEYAASRNRLGIRSKRCWIGTVHGAEVVFVYLEVDDSMGMSHLVSSMHPFDCWYRQKLREVYGLDVAQYHRSLLLEQAFAWSTPGAGISVQEER